MIHPSGGQPLAGLSAARGVGHTQGVFGVFSYYQLVMFFLNMVCLTVALACCIFRRMAASMTKAAALWTQNIFGVNLVNSLIRGQC
jgi:hypothetical protein